MKTYADKLVKRIYSIISDTPEIRSDKQRKRTMYILIRSEIANYKQKAEEERKKNTKKGIYERPSEDEMRIHIISNLVTLGKMEEGMSSKDWGLHICNVVGAYEQSWK